MKSSLSRSSTTSRSAVLRPIPGTATIAGRFSSRIARASAAGLSPDSAASASLGPTPLTAISRSKSRSSSAAAKPNSSSASSRTTWRVRSRTSAPSGGSAASVGVDTCTW